MGRLEEISKRRTKAHEKLTSLKSKTYEAFLEMEKAAYEENLIEGAVFMELKL